VGRDDFNLMRDTQFVENVSRMLHGRPIALAAHNNADFCVAHNRLRYFKIPRLRRESAGIA